MGQLRFSDIHQDSSCHLIFLSIDGVREIALSATSSSIAVVTDDIAIILHVWVYKKICFNFRLYLSIFIMQ